VFCAEWELLGECSGAMEFEILIDTSSNAEGSKVCRYGKSAVRLRRKTNQNLGRNLERLAAR
jgi:hypothetical protein